MIQPTNRYDDYVLVHVAAGLGAHQRPAFLPWHRRYLEYFEADLQAAANDPNLTIPYWDWSDNTSSPFTNDFLGGNGNSGDSYKVTTGPFASAANQWELKIITGLAQNTGAKDDVNYLRRHFGLNSISLNPSYNLPPASYLRQTVAVAAYDASPWNSGNTTTGFRNRLEGWFNPPGVLAPPLLHNMGHVWTGGTMLPPSSPNDPVFWLNHAMVDMLWAVWQARHGNPYLPGAAENHANLQINGVYRHRFDDDMLLFSEIFGAAAKPSAMLSYHTPAAPSTGYWYQTDIPEITQETGPTLSFGDVPQGLTQYKGVRFRVRSCRPVKFRITTSPSGDFFTPMGTQFLLTPEKNQPFSEILVWFAYTAPAPGNLVNSAVQIRAFMDDDEGYFAANPGDEYPLGIYDVTLTAKPESRPSAATVLVLDYSGSMNADAGGSTKRDLMINAASVFAGLLRNNLDGVGLVRYSTTATKVMDVTLGNAGLGTSIFNTLNAINATGFTSIGAGITEGLTVLNAGQAAAVPPFSRLATVVLTDGKENTIPLIANVAASITNTTYAVGFGTPNQVDTAKLNQITQNNGGDLVITGDISSQQQQFLLTKYFVQILAGITKQNTVLDPQGELFWGSTHRIPFDLADSDVTSDVIVICPFPLLLDFHLVAPNGKIIKPASAAGEPNIEFRNEKRAAFYRMGLPALSGDPGGSHGGRWHAVLSLKEEGVKELMQDPEFEAFWFSRKKRSLDYSLIVNVYSNLDLEVSLQQNDFLSGSKVSLYARLTEFGVPLNRPATVWADVTLPDGGQSTLQLEAGGSADGRYQASITTSLNGLYGFRIRATTSTAKGLPVTREKTLTASAISPEVSTNPPVREENGEGNRALCELINCILDKGINHRLAERLQEWGVDLEVVRECLKRYCKTRTAPTFLSSDHLKPVKPLGPSLLTEFPQLNSLVEVIERESFLLQDHKSPFGIDTAKPGEAQKPTLPKEDGFEASATAQPMLYQQQKDKTGRKE